MFSPTYSSFSPGCNSVKSRSGKAASKYCRKKVSEKNSSRSPTGGPCIPNIFKMSLPNSRIRYETIEWFEKCGSYSPHQTSTARLPRSHHHSPFTIAIAFAFTIAWLATAAFAIAAIGFIGISASAIAITAGVAWVSSYPRCPYLKYLNKKWNQC